MNLVWITSANWHYCIYDNGAMCSSLRLYTHERAACSNLGSNHSSNGGDNNNNGEGNEKVVAA